MIKKEHFFHSITLIFTPSIIRYFVLGGIGLMPTTFLYWFISLKSLYQEGISKTVHESDVEQMRELLSNGQIVTIMGSSAVLFALLIFTVSYFLCSVFVEGIKCINFIIFSDGGK